MTNGEKYKSAQERIEAMDKWCKERWCKNCVLHEHGIKSAECALHWLDLEAVEEKPLPCPFCGNIPTVHEICEDAFAVSCVLESCGYWSRIGKTREEAIAVHNRVAKAVMESEAK